MLRAAIRNAALVLAVLCAANAAFFLVRTMESRRLVRAFVAETLAGVPRDDRDAVVHALALGVYHRTNRALPLRKLPIYDRFEAEWFFNVPTGSSLRHGYYGVLDSGPFGPCGTMSRVLLHALWQLDIPARKLQLLVEPGSGLIQHTMVEYRVGDRWQVISPSDSGFRWRNRAGQVATVAEIRADSTIFRQVYAWRPWWPTNFEHTANIRWEKLPAPVRGAFRAVLGEEGYRNAETPRLYEQPRRLFFALSAGAMLLFALVAWWAGRGARPRPAARRPA